MEPEPASVDPSALDAHRGRMQRLALGLVRDHDRAEDVVHETCLRALTGSVRPRHGLAACLAGVVRNVASKAGRGEARRRARERHRARPETVPSTVDLLTHLEEQQRVLASVRALDEPHRTAILLRYLEGLAPREIARRTGVPLATVKSRLKRGLHRLRQDLDRRHGGSRRSWMAVWLPMAGIDVLPRAASWNLGREIVMRSAQSKTTVAVGVLLLLGAAAWVGGEVLWSDGEAPTAATLEAPTAGETQAAAAAPRPPMLAPGAASAAGRAPADPDRTATGGPGEAPTVPGTVEHDPRDAGSPPPAVRRSPYGLPPRRPGSRGGPSGGGPGGGPTGHWTRFGPFPQPSGRARLLVRIEDEEGRPVPRADVYLGPPDTAGQEGISFGDLRKLGQAGPDGTLSAEALPEGAAAVFGNLDNRLNGPRGLDGRHGVGVVLDARAPAEVRVRLPFSADATGALAGRVLDPEGAPVASASVAVGYLRAWTKADGTYELVGIPAGRATLGVRATGYAAQRLDVEVDVGRTTRSDVTLAYEASGTARIRGMVTGPQDEPVAGADVYLMLKAERGTLRHVRTDEAGGFVMEQLPERVRTEALRLQASRLPLYASALLDLPAGLQDERVALRMAGRYVQFEVVLLDATTGEPIRQAQVTAYRPESRQPTSTLPFVAARGVRQGMVEPGRHTVRVDALDHEDVEFAVDVVPDSAWRFRQELRLRRLGPPSVQVALTVRLTDAVHGDAIGQALIEVLTEDGEALSRLEGRREDGAFRLPAPSGRRRLRVTAPGHEPYDAPLELEPQEPEALVEVVLRPR